jgi:hypothetical protein
MYKNDAERKAAMNEYQKKYYHERYKQKKKEYAGKRYILKRDEIIESNRNYTKKNMEKITAKSRARYQKNPEKFRLADRRFYYSKQMREAWATEALQKLLAEEIAKLSPAASVANERMHESAALARRIEELEKKAEALREENREILLTIEEVLQDNKRFRDFHKYGIKPEL